MASESSANDLWTHLEGVARPKTYEKGSFLFQQGSLAAGVYLIKKGEVRVWMPEESGPMAMVTLVRTGTMLGLSEAICEETHKLSALAVTRVEVALVSHDALMKYLESHHDVCMQVVRLLSEDLHGLYHRFQRLHFSGSRHRRTGSDRIV